MMQLYLFWAVSEFRRIAVRLIQGETELLLGLGIIEMLGMQGDFVERKSHVGWGEWHATVRIIENRWVSRLPQHPADTQKRELIFGNRQSGD